MPWEENKQSSHGGARGPGAISKHLPLRYGTARPEQIRVCPERWADGKLRVVYQ